jgi:hypothetical protein
VTYPPVDEPSQQRRAIVYGRANQGSAHYRPLRKGRPTGEPAPAAGREAKAAIRRRVVLFVVALVVAVASGIAIVGVVLASTAPIGQAPHAAQPAPEPATQPLPPTGWAAPAEIAPPPAGKSGSPESTTAPGGATTKTKPPAGEGGKPATSAAVVYQNCNKARRAGAAPLYPGDPGYSKKLDKDGNGIACDEKEKGKA